MTSKPPTPKAQEFYSERERTVPAWRAWQLSALAFSTLSLAGYWTLTSTAGEARRAALVTPPGEPPRFTMLLAGRDIAYCYYRTPCRDQNTKTGLWQPPNTDTLMLVKVDGTRVNVLSIPRDTNVGPFNPDRGIAAQKVNSQYFRGGPEALAQAVEVITGERIDYYAVVRTEFVAAVIDSLGGLDVNVPDIPAYGNSRQRGIHFDDYAAGLHVHLDPGQHRLKGKDAVAYLRMRKGFGDDYGRMDHQKTAIAQLVDKLRSPANLTGALPTILRGMNGSVETNAHPALVQQMLPYLRDYKLSFATLPTHEIPGTSNLAADREALMELWGGGGLAHVTLQHAPIRIFDASGRNLGEKVAWALRARGLNVLEVKHEPQSGERSQTFTLNAVSSAETVARWLDLPRLQGLRFPVNAGEVGVYLGADAVRRYAELTQISIKTENQ